jgi:hypothetical protein
MDNPTVFFSYSRADSDFVLRLAKDLRSEGVNLWIDQLDIAAGDRWDRAVEDALGAAPCLLVVLSPASVESHNVMDEVSLAFDERKKIVPVLARECTIPFRLRRLQNIDFTVDYDRGLERVLEALKAPRQREMLGGRDGSQAAAAVSPPRREPVPPRPETGSKGGVPRRYVYAAVGLVALVAVGVAWLVLSPRLLDQPRAGDSTGSGPGTVASAPAGTGVTSESNPTAGPGKGPLAELTLGPDTGATSNLPQSPAPGPPTKSAAATDAAPAAKLAPAPDERDATYSPSPDSTPKTVSALPPPPPAPAKPVNGTFDITMSCPNGSQVNEYGARFTDGMYARTYNTENGTINTQLALGYTSTTNVKLAGSVAFEQYGVQAVDASAKKKGRSWSGLGTYGPTTNCKLAIVDRN